jgi:hypothetical protein
MNYDFKTTEEFRDFIIDALQSGRYNQEIQNLTKGINTISNSNNSWDWIEEGKLYVVTNRALKSPAKSSETLYIIFAISNPKTKQWLPSGGIWYIPLYKKSAYGVDFTYISLFGAGPVDLWEMRGKSWVKEYILLDSHSGFINWNKNPFENK